MASQTDTAPAARNRFVMAVADMRRANEPDRRHPGRDGGPNPGRAVLDHDRPRRVDAQTCAGMKMQVRGRLGFRHLGAAEQVFVGKMMVEPGDCQRPANPLRPRIGTDTAAVGEIGQDLVRPRDRLQFGLKPAA